MFDTSILHPMLVHFPIALILTGFLLEIIATYKRGDLCTNKAAFVLLLLGTLSAYVAATAGGLFTPDFTGKAGDVENTHQTFAGISITLFTITSVLYIYAAWSKKAVPDIINKLGFLFYTLSAISVSITGFYGGELVYNILLKM